VVTFGKYIYNDCFIIYYYYYYQSNLIHFLLDLLTLAFWGLLTHNILVSAVLSDQTFTDLHLWFLYVAVSQNRGHGVQSLRPVAKLVIYFLLNFILFIDGSLSVYLASADMVFDFSKMSDTLIGILVISSFRASIIE